MFSIIRPGPLRLLEFEIEICSSGRLIRSFIKDKETLMITLSRAPAPRLVHILYVSYYKTWSFKAFKV